MNRRKQAQADVQKRIDAIKAVWEPGDSAAQIGEKVGMSRQAIIGLFDRHKERLHPAHLNPGRTGGAAFHRKSKPPASVKRDPKKKPEPRYDVSARRKEGGQNSAIKNKVNRILFVGDVTSAPLPVMDDGPHTPLHIPLHDLKESHCRWIYGEKADITYCGVARKEPYSYCPHHCKLVYQNFTGRRSA